MRGHRTKDIGQQDLLRSRLDMQLDMNHKLVRLSRLIDWERLDAEISQMFPARSGRPATRTRLIAGLMYLQHSGGFSDESVVSLWVENPYSLIRTYFSKSQKSLG